MKERKVLLLGHGGQLGSELHKGLSGQVELTSLDYPEVDFTRPQSLPAVVESARPQIIINAAGYTDVDRAESEPERAHLINAASPGKLMEAAAGLGALLIHISTDYVFDGLKGAPYVETDAPRPVSLYGQSKLDGELAVQQAGGDHLILRTSWMYGGRRANFVLKVMEWARKSEIVRVADDQIGNPTAAGALARVIVQLLTGHELAELRSHAGLYHLGGSGWTSRYEWARTILRFDPHPAEWAMKEILPVPSTYFPTPARRPLNTSMICDKFQRVFGIILPHWQESVRQAILLAQANHSGDSASAA